MCLKLNFLDNGTDFEKKHTPVISAPSEVNAGELFEIKAEVGKVVSHPNQAEHYISWTKIFVDDAEIMTTTFTPGKTDFVAKATLKLEKNAKIKAMSYCNLHGLWVSCENIKVK